MLLAFDACGAAPSLALADGSELRCFRQLAGGRGQADRLPAAVEALLTQHPLSSITALAVITGPGSYTGLRACLALVKGLALAWQLPVFGISAFACLAEMAEAEPQDLLLIDAGRGRVWGQLAGDGHKQSVIEPVSDWVARAWSGQRVIGHATALAQWPKELLSNTVEIDLNAHALVYAVQRRAARGIGPQSGRDILPLYLASADAQLSKSRSLVSAQPSTAS